MSVVEYNHQDLQDLQQAHDTLSSLLSASSGSVVENAMTGFGSYGSGMKKDHHQVNQKALFPLTRMVLAKVIPNRFAPFGSPGRIAYLDSFLENVVMEHPSWRLAFNERWWDISSRTSYVL